MQQNERVFFNINTSSQVDNALKELHKAQEKPSLKKLGTIVLDMSRDINTASKMAENEFDGDSALMYAARGLVSLGVGAGMEKAMDALWENVWQGKETLIDRFKVSSDVAKQLNSLALDTKQGAFNWKARLTHVIKEGTEDISIGAIYNMILGFRAQPLFTKVEPKHLIRSLSLDVLEALLSPSLPSDIKKRAEQSNTNILDAEIKQKATELRQLQIGGKITTHVPYEDKRNERRFMPKADNLFNNEITSLKDEINRKNYAKVAHYKNLYQPSQLENFIRSGLNISNPVSQLGIDMIWSALREFKKNWKEVRKVRAEKGIVGKKVEMEKKYEKKEWGNRDQGGRWQGNKDKVYYGKSNWKSADQKAQEEYELKAAS